ncbi:MAG: HEAT repeat domain-containing protein [Nitrospiraceae bacterium]
MSGMIRTGLVTWLAVVSAVAPCNASAAVVIEWPRAVPVQMPFEAPPKPKPAPDTAVRPSTRALDAEELKRAEALLPLLEGKQELWAMGEFVHLGAPAVPVLVKALAMPSPRARYNAIETLSMINDASVVPALIESAKAPTEIPRVREHALRVAVRLDPTLVSPAIEALAKDPNPTLRKAVAFEARYVRQKAMVPVLIELMQDDERFVAISAIQSLWLLTRHESEMHDWDTSTKQDRVEWAQEWITWWEANQETFQLPDQRRPKKPLKQG